MIIKEKFRGLGQDCYITVYDGKTRISVDAAFQNIPGIDEDAQIRAPRDNAYQITAYTDGTAKVTAVMLINAPKSEKELIRAINEIVDEMKSDLSIPELVENGENNLTGRPHAGC